MKNEKKQTAVEWLVDNLIELGYLHSVDYGQSPKIKEVIEQAKKRDREQKLNMFNCGRQYQVTGEGTFKQVYQETYGGGDK